MEQICILAEQEIDKLREQVATLEAEKQMLENKLKEQRQKPFKKDANKVKQTSEEKQLFLFESPVKLKSPKLGAPCKHRGITRKKPTQIDKYVDVYPQKCVSCGSKNLNIYNRYTLHIEQDVEIKTKNIAYRHYSAYCHDCKKISSSIDTQEVKRGYLGSNARAIALNLRYMGLSFRKIKQIFADVFGLDITPSAILGFEQEVAEKGRPFYEHIKQEIQVSEVIGIDETGWPQNGNNHWAWCFTNRKLCYIKITNSRGSKVVQETIGEEYPGIIISDFYSAYNPVKARAKQKCLAHLLRDIKNLFDIVKNDARQKFLTPLKKLIKGGINAYQGWLNGQLSSSYLSILKGYFIKRLEDLTNIQLFEKEAEALQKRVIRHKDELFTFLEHPQIVEPTNNHTERQLRPGVIMRKITFGNKSLKGEETHSIITSIIQTARLNGKRPFDVFVQLFSNKDGISLFDLSGLKQKNDSAHSNQLLLPFAIDKKDINPNSRDPP
jgi:hypothetical protein